MRNSDVSSREEKEARETILQNASLKPLRYYHADEEKANNNKESGSGSFSDDDEKEGGLGLLPPISPRVYAGAKDLRFKETDWRRFGVLHLLACALATICTLGVYGILQQRIMTIPYGGDDASEGGDIFTSSIFLVFSNRACSLLLGLVALAYTKPERVSLFSREWWWPHSSMENYMYVASSNLVSTLCQYEVLKYLSFALSTLRSG